MAYEPPNHDYNNPKMQYSVDQNQFEPQTSRPRASSNVRGDGNMQDISRFVPPHRPLDEAATSAVGDADNPHYVPPEIIAQITANVINQLKNTGIDGTTPTPTTHTQFPPPPPPIQQPVPLSPSAVSASSQSMYSRNIYTSPSPRTHSDLSNHGSPPPQPAFSENWPTSPPPHVQSHDRKTSSPLSQTSDSSYARPKGPTRLSTSREETTLEKIWGQLFDEEGNATARLGQFLRGLAVHIVCSLLGNLGVVLEKIQLTFFADRGL